MDSCSKPFWLAIWFETNWLVLSCSDQDKLWWLFLPIPLFLQLSQFPHCVASSRCSCRHLMLRRRILHQYPYGTAAIFFILLRFKLASYKFSPALHFCTKSACACSLFCVAFLPSSRSFSWYARLKANPHGHFFVLLLSLSLSLLASPHFVVYPSHRPYHSFDTSFAYQLLANRFLIAPNQ